MKLRNLILKFFMVACVAFVCVLASCATNRAENGAPIYRVYMTNSKRVTLLPVSAMSGNIDGLYQMTADFSGTALSVLAYVVADDAGITADLLSDFGSSLGTLEYGEKGIALNSEIFPKDFPPEYVVMDFQNAFYDVTKLQSAYEKAHLKFEVSIACGDAETTETRTIYDGKKIVEEIVITTAGGTSAGGGSASGGALAGAEASASGEASANGGSRVITITNFLRGYAYTLVEAE